MKKFKDITPSDLIYVWAGGVLYVNFVDKIKWQQHQLCPHEIIFAGSNFGTFFLCHTMLDKTLVESSCQSNVWVSIDLKQLLKHMIKTHVQLRYIHLPQYSKIYKKLSSKNLNILHEIEKIKNVKKIRKIRER